jgi:hypothetical protein
LTHGAHHTVHCRLAVHVARGVGPRGARPISPLIFLVIELKYSLLAGSSPHPVRCASRPSQVNARACHTRSGCESMSGFLNCCTAISFAAHLLAFLALALDASPRLGLDPPSSRLQASHSRLSTWWTVRAIAMTRLRATVRAHSPLALHGLPNSRTPGRLPDSRTSVLAPWPWGRHCWQLAVTFFVKKALL